MPTYRIHRIKETPRLAFRFAAHTGGIAQVKPRDYEPGMEVEAAHPYGAWRHLSGTEQALRVGDLLEAPDGALSICKYVGFEEARWALPEPRQPALEPLGVPPLPEASSTLVS